MAASSRGDILKTVDIRALLGSGFLWAWVDALFMSSFFAPSPEPGPMSEVAAIGISILGVPICLILLWRIDLAYRAIASRRILVGTGITGSIGSALLIISALTGNWIVLYCGMALCAFYMSYAISSWGAVYCKDSVKSATVYVTGGFALALVVDLLSLAMLPLGHAIMPALLPILSSLLLLSLGDEDRAYDRHGGDKPASSGTGTATIPTSAMSTASSTPAISSAPARNGVLLSLGVGKTTILSLILVMIGFGYTQHLMSFSHLQGMGIAGGVAIQIARGIAAAILFVLVLLAPRKTSIVYRISLLAIVAGFSLMPFLAGTDYFWLSGAVIMVGYTIFDVLIWVVVAQASCIHHVDALKTVLVVRQIINGSCILLGSAIGILSANLIPSSSYAHPEAIFLGYLMTVAIVLLLSSSDIWGLISARKQNATSGTGAGDTMDERIERLSTEWGLTKREQDIFRLLAIGRTQPWIAENQGISESTVNTHVRHVYQKAGVNSRQELLDFVIRPDNATAPNE